LNERSLMPAELVTRHAEKSSALAATCVLTAAVSSATALAAVTRRRSNLLMSDTSTPFETAFAETYRAAVPLGVMRLTSYYEDGAELAR